MKNKKILLLSLALLGVVGTSIGMNGYQNVLNKATAYSTGVTVSLDGKTKSINPSAVSFHNVNSTSLTSDHSQVNKNAYYYDAEDGILYRAGESKWSPSVKFQKMDIYFELSANAAGTLTITCNGSADDRFMYFIKDGKPLETESTKFAYTKKAVVSQTFDSSLIEAIQFDENDNVVTANGVTTRYFIGLTANGSDYKVDLFEIALTTGSFTAQSYNVTYWDSNGTNEYLEFAEAVGEGLSPKVSPIPSFKEGYKFVGWTLSPNGDDLVIPTSYVVTSDVKFYAKWEEVATHKVTFIDYEGADPREVIYNEGDELILSDPAKRDNFKFVGWYSTPTYDDSSLITEGTIVDKEMTLYAKWEEAQVVTVTFMVEEETVLTQTTFANEKVAKFPDEPKKAGYKFVGWVDDNGTTYDINSTFKESITLKAKFELIEEETIAFQDYNLTTTAQDEFKINDYISFLSYGKSADQTASTQEGVNFTKAAQAKRLKVTLSRNANITIYLTQTSSDAKVETRNIGVIDGNGYTHLTNKHPANKGATQLNLEQKFTLKAGTYEFYGYNTTDGDTSSPQFNFYGIKIDYTNSEQLVDELETTQSVKLNIQEGKNISENKPSMRFVGEINASFEEIVSVNLKVEVTKETLTETLINGDIYVLYEKLTLESANKYDAVSGRLYFEYVVDIDQEYKSLKCDAKVTLSSGIYNLSQNYIVSSTQVTE